MTAKQVRNVIRVITALASVLSVSCLLGDLGGFINLSDKAVKDACYIMMMSMLTFMFLLTDEAFERQKTK